MANETSMIYFVLLESIAVNCVCGQLHWNWVWWPSGMLHANYTEEEKADYIYIYIYILPNIKGLCWYINVIWCPRTLYFLWSTMCPDTYLAPMLLFQKFIIAIEMLTRNQKPVFIVWLTKFDHLENTVPTIDEEAGYTVFLPWSKGPTTSVLFNFITRRTLTVQRSWLYRTSTVKWRSYLQQALRSTKPLNLANKAHICHVLLFPRVYFAPTINAQDPEYTQWCCLLLLKETHSWRQQLGQCAMCSCMFALIENILVTLR